MNIQGKSIYLIGDSQLEGLGPRIKPMLLAAGASHVEYMARRGWATRDYLRSGRLDSLPPADIYIVELGGNDAAKGLVGDALEDRVREIVRKLPAREAIFWVGPSETLRSDLQTPAGPTSRPEAALRIARALPANVTFIPGERLIETSYLRDGLHYTATGYTRFAENLKNEIVRTVAGTGWTPWIVGASLISAVAIGVYFGRR